MIKKIMIVDDSSMMRSIIKNFINKSGMQFEYVEAADGDDALNKYKASKPDLVFMDIMMPKVDGITAASNIRLFDPNAKILMCTSIKEQIHEEEAKKIGVVGYITKPFNSEQIIQAIEKNFH